jgi:hypothetical protein
LLVVLDLVDRPGVRLGRVGTELALCLPLAKQVPALVELFLELLPSSYRRLASAASTTELVLFSNQSGDAREQIVVGHRCLHGCGRRNMEPRRRRQVDGCAATGRAGSAGSAMTRSEIAAATAAIGRPSTTFTTASTEGPAPAR